MYEGYVESGEFPGNAVRVLEDRNAGLPPDSRDRFFLPYSTTLGSPEWCLATLPWLDPLIGRQVSAFFLLYSTTLGSPEWCLATLPWLDLVIGREESAFSKERGS